MKHTRFLTSALALALCSCLALASPSSEVAPASEGGQDGLKQASALLDTFDFAGAKKLLEARVAEDAKDADAWQKLGLALFGLRSFEQAGESFAKAEELKPDDGLTLFYRGVLVLIETRVRDKEARSFFDRSAAIESPVQGSAQLMKYSLMKYITIPGRSVSKEFDAWRAKLDANSWLAQRAHYIRRPVSNEKFAEQRASHEGEMDSRDLDLQMNLLIGLRLDRTLFGYATDHLKEGLALDRPGSVEWELSRVWFSRIGYIYNWLPELGFSYRPTDEGVPRVGINDRDSFAYARGLKNKDEILELDGMKADVDSLSLVFQELKVGDTYELKIRRDGEEKTLLLVVDTLDYQMRATGR